MIKIEKGIPLPETTKGAPLGEIRGPRPRKYPFYDMEVGDSFLVRTETERRSVMACKRNVELRTGRVFTTRLVPGGTRVWRIK